MRIRHFLWAGSFDALTLRRWMSIRRKQQAYNAQHADFMEAVTRFEMACRKLRVK